MANPNNSSQKLTPNQVSQELNRIATTIEHSQKPRRDLVAADLKKLLNQIEEK